MHALNSQKVGLTFAIFSGAMRLVWTLLVATGLAQPVLDGLFRISSIEPAHTVTSFSLGSSLALIVFGMVQGYVAGLALAAIWNRLSDSRRLRSVP